MMLQRFTIAALATAAALALAGCASPTPTPTATSAPPPTPTEAAAGTPTPAVVPTAAPTVAATPTESDARAFTLTASEIGFSLPDSIAFSLEGQGARTIEVVDVEFGTERVFSCASSSYTSARIDFEPSRDVSVEWEWDMRRTGSIPPGSVVWWRWRLVDDQGKEFRTARQEAVYADDRFDWETYESDNITFYWYVGGPDFGERLARGVRDGLDTLQLGKALTAPIKAFVYESSTDVQGAVLFAQAWTGGLAFTSSNILLITVSPDTFERDLPGVVHELAHLLIGEVTFNCFGDLPRWLDEGLAVYSEGRLPPFQRTQLDEAIATDDLISLRSLNSSFPAADTGATLSYAQSWSIVDYLLRTHGWGKMQELLAVFAEGASYESAIERVYGMDTDALETAWRRSLGLGAR